MKVELTNSKRLKLKLLEPLACGSITVPAGFQTDLATIPKALWSILPPFGRYSRAAVVHDYIYTELTGIYTRKQADVIFRNIMKADGVGSVTRNSMYYAVRMGGRGNWKKV